MVDLTEVHGLTFEVARDDVLKMLDAKVAILTRASQAWTDASTDEKYLEAQTVDERKKAADKARSEGLPPQMAPAPPQMAAIVRISKKNARTMRQSADQWAILRKYLSARAVFVLNQEQLTSLAVDDADKMFPPDWPGVLD